MSLTDGWPQAPEPLPRPVVDNHCHLDTRIRGGALIPVDEALDRAAAVGVTRTVQVGCDLESSRWAVEIARQQPSIVAAVAMHPNDAARSDTLEDDLAEIDRLAADPVVRAVGETGLDYFRTGAEGRPAQQYAFRRHIRIAKRHDRTLVIHDRDAHDDVLAVLDDEGVPDRVVMHCFSGDADFARRCLDRGAYLSFAGTVTFKNAEYLRDALRIAPRDRILVETDAPFLTPMPHRGEPNASFLIPHTVRFMAEVLDTDLADLCEAIDENTDRAFGGHWPERGDIVV
ncbi:TatD family hydrolase [Aeromicrobium duanguangcaii]|uniref:TatD family hydrolase n=1 Tax=Aeromicrobium duanguangcaii TaxID=2968086 RepID=A0ABY5KF78_9ACTN|nr:TatD family hydrolase [Aeromicrobium duanguangcaii]MCD9153810.1 TatD family hydrolase [Aeromicrobium duanguangcaii]UUI69107.1 TatD family hydrolase [Aeromicrobium duanguangcaii]